MIILVFITIGLYGWFVNYAEIHTPKESEFIIEDYQKKSKDYKVLKVEDIQPNYSYMDSELNALTSVSSIIIPPEDYDKINSFEDYIEWSLKNKEPYKPNLLNINSDSFDADSAIYTGTTFSIDTNMMTRALQNANLSVDDMQKQKVGLSQLALFIPNRDHISVSSSKGYQLYNVTFSYKDKKYTRHMWIDNFEQAERIKGILLNDEENGYLKNNQEVSDILYPHPNGSFPKDVYGHAFTEDLFGKKYNLNLHLTSMPQGNTVLSLNADKAMLSNNTNDFYNRTLFIQVAVEDRNGQIRSKTFYKKFTNQNKQLYRDLVLGEDTPKTQYDDMSFLDMIQNETLLLKSDE